MDFLLVGLHAIFFASVLVRLTRRPAAKPNRVDRNNVAGASVFAPHAPSILILHGAGLGLLYAGLTAALAAGRIARSTSPQGALGAVIILSADILMAWSITALRSWRLLPQVDAGHQLCTTGPYGFVRHPMYLAVDLLGLGSAVWVPTPIVMLAAALLMVGGDLRGRAEEKVLLQAFGDRYRDYMRAVRRTLPGVY
jgi:protein-S-isoprenylcysteine O-methyltransferase Ste14